MRSLRDILWRELGLVSLSIFSMTLVFGRCLLWFVFGHCVFAVSLQANEQGGEEVESVETQENVASEKRSDDKEIAALEVAPPLPVAEQDQVNGDDGARLLEKEESINVADAEPEASQAGVKGLVIDSATGAGLEGVGVGIEGLDLWTSTNANGDFTFDAVPLGEYELSFSKLGFVARVEQIEVKVPGVSDLQIMLDPKRDAAADEEYTLDDYDVVADYEEEDIASIMLGSAQGGAIGSGLGQEEFSASGISDAAEAVGKISGANIVGGKYAVIRGLGDRYSNTTVNGALISSADPSRKAIQLDLFPSNLLQNVIVYKTFTPNLTGEFAGGLVALETLSLPEERILEVGFGITGYEAHGGDFYVNPDGDFSFFGYRDDGLPSEIGPDVSDFNPGSRRGSDDAVEDWNALHASAGFRPKKRSPLPATSFSLTYADTFEWGGDSKLGAVFAFSRSGKDSVKEGVIVGRNVNVGADGLSGSDDDFLNRTQVENEYNRSVEYGLLGSLNYQLNDRHQIGMTYFKNHVAEDQVKLVRRVDDEIFGSLIGTNSSDNDFGAPFYAYGAADQITTLVRDLNIVQLNGEHFLGEKDRSTKIDWFFSRTTAEEARPQSRITYLNELDFTHSQAAASPGYDPSRGSVLTLGDFSGENPPANFSVRQSLNTDESALNGAFDIAVPFYFDDEGDDRFELGLGFNRNQKDRQVRGRIFAYTTGSSLSSRLLTEGGGQFGIDFADGFNDIFDPDGNPIFNGSNVARLGARNYFLIEETTGSGNTVGNIDAFTGVQAFYLMPSLHLDAFYITGGVRMEKETRGYEALARLNPSFIAGTSAQQEETNFLPSFLMQYTFGGEDEHLISASWSNTIARPTFYEFAPVRTIDQATGELTEGNPDLTDTIISNFDLRWDWGFAQDQLFSINLFYKDLDSPIAETIENGRKSWINGDSGVLRGVELEYRKQFTESWSMSANYTFIDSLLEYQQNLGASGVQLIQSTFDGQPEHIFNFNLGYDNEEYGYSANLVYNFTGDYLTSVPADSSTPGVTRSSRHTLDLITKKDIELFGSDATVTFEVGNLLDSSIDFEYKDVGIYESYYPGRSYKLSMKLSF